MNYQRVRAVDYAHLIGRWVQMERRATHRERLNGEAGPSDTVGMDGVIAEVRDTNYGIWLFTEEGTSFRVTPRDQELWTFTVVDGRPAEQPDSKLDQRADSTSDVSEPSDMSTEAEDGWGESTADPWAWPEDEQWEQQTSRGTSPTDPGPDGEHAVQCDSTWPLHPGPRDGHAACHLMLGHFGLHMDFGGRTWADETMGDETPVNPRADLEPTPWPDSLDDIDTEEGLIRLAQADPGRFVRQALTDAEQRAQRDAQDYIQSHRAREGQAR